MATFNNPLDSIKVASPCSADWESMVGNNRTRFCGQCKLNVYNLSGMTRTEAENLLMNSEGRVCARFFRRADGTVLTKDCPVGWAAVKKRMSRVWTAVASMVITAVSGIGMVTAFNSITEVEHTPTIGSILVEKEPLTGKVLIEPSSNMGGVKMGEVNTDPQAQGVEMGDLVMPE